MHRLDLFPTEEVMQSFRKIPEDALLQMIADFGVFEYAVTPEDMALRNQGIRFLEILGGGKIDRDAIIQFTKRLMKQPLKQEE